eukprot:154267-Ditylum_brightwellii.AAC.1
MVTDLKMGISCPVVILCFLEVEVHSSKQVLGKIEEIMEKRVAIFKRGARGSFSGTAKVISAL